MEKIQKPAQLPNPTQEITTAISALEAIKGYAILRQHSNLREALSKLQGMFAQTLLDTLASTPDGLTSNEIAYAREGKHIDAIRAIRQRTGMPVTEAKEMVTAWQKENGVDPCGGHR